MPATCCASRSFLRFQDIAASSHNRAIALISSVRFGTWIWIGSMPTSRKASIGFNMPKGAERPRILAAMRAPRVS